MHRGWQHAGMQSTGSGRVVLASSPLRLSLYRRRRFWACPAATVPGDAAVRKAFRPREKFSPAEILTSSTTWPGKDMSFTLMYNNKLSVTFYCSLSKAVFNSFLSYPRIRSYPRKAVTKLGYHKKKFMHRAIHLLEIKKGWKRFTAYKYLSTGYSKSDGWLSW